MTTTTAMIEVRCGMKMLLQCLATLDEAESMICTAMASYTPAYCSIPKTVTGLLYTCLYKILDLHRSIMVKPAVF